MYSFEYFEELFRNRCEDQGDGDYAVLSPLIRVKGESHLLFEVRALHMRRQPGEVCFPGGRIEPGETAVQCAARETGEELRLDPEQIRPIGSVSQILSWMNEKVDIVMGEIGGIRLEDIRPNPDEVHEVFTVPFSYFMEREPQDSYTYEGHYIWGLTARSIHQIMKLCKGE